MSKRKFKLKQDSYRKSRGGKAQFFVLFCRNCGEKLMLYQKDYPNGLLKRLYLDRIVAPSVFRNLRNLPLRKVPQLVCAECNHVIGVPYLYPKENRAAYMVEIGGLRKKISRGEF